MIEYDPKRSFAVQKAELQVILENELAKEKKNG